MIEASKRRTHTGDVVIEQHHPPSTRFQRATDLFRVPVRLFSRHRSIYLVLLGVVLFNVLTPGTEVLNEIGQPGWIFDELPGVVADVVMSPIGLVLLLLLFLINVTITVLVAQEMALLFSRRRSSLGQSLRSVRVEDLAWFAVMKLAVYAVFACTAAALYLPALALWKGHGVDLTIPLLAIAALLYPVFYAVLSAISMVAVFPTPSRDRLSVLHALTKGRAVRTLYGFYVARIVAEGILLFVVPLVALRAIDSPLLASLSIASGLLLPLSFLRGAAYELKLRLLRDNLVVAEMFSRHFAEVGASSGQR